MRRGLRWARVGWQWSVRSCHRISLVIVARRRSGVFAEQSAAGATRLRRASVEKAAEAAAAAARGAAAVAQSGGQEFAEITAESVLNAGKESIKTRAA